ncbi:hypothetical protein D3C85_793530 [compost metagenome]
MLLLVRQLRQLASVVGRGGRLGPDGVAHVADVADVAVDLVRHPALLLRRAGNLLVHLVDGTDRLDDLLQHADRQLHLAERHIRLAVARHDRLDHRLGARLQLADQGLDLDDGILGATGQVAHLVGHHCEAAPLLAGPGGLDGGIERQQVGLLGDPLNDDEDVVDVVAVGRQPLHHRLGVADHRHQPGHGLLGVGHHGLALLRRRVGLIGRIHRRVGIARHLQGGGAELLERGGNQIDLLILGLHAGTGALGPLRRLGRAGPGAGDRIDHLADGGLQLVEEVVEPPGQLTDLVIALQIDALGQIPLAAGDVLETGHHGANGGDYPPRHQPDAEQGEQRDHATDQQLRDHAALGLAFEFPLQLQGRGEHHGTGQLDVDAPLAIGATHPDRHEGLQ